jgi:hypothetical protein
LNAQRTSFVVDINVNWNIASKIDEEYQFLVLDGQEVNPSSIFAIQYGGLIGISQEIFGHGFLMTGIGINHIENDLSLNVSPIRDTNLLLLDFYNHTTKTYYLNIPLELGYNFKNDGISMFGIYAGFSFNTMLSYRQKMILSPENSSDYTNYLVTDIKNELDIQMKPFKNNMTFSAGLAFSSFQVMHVAMGITYIPKLSNFQNTGNFLMGMNMRMYLRHDKRARNTKEFDKKSEKLIRYY